jgi:pimeloyl-ACP methyl ester carboxylesterase
MPTTIRKAVSSSAGGKRKAQRRKSSGDSNGGNYVYWTGTYIERVHGDLNTHAAWHDFAAASYGDWTKQLMGYSIQCDEKWAAFAPEEVARVGQGSLLLGWNLLRSTNFTLVCKYLPRGVDPAGVSDQPPSQVPVLLFNGELDPLDPPANTTRAKEIWPNSLPVVLPGQGHSLSNQSTVLCVMQLTEKFVADVSVQNLPLDCLKDIQPPAFDTRE